MPSFADSFWTQDYSSGVDVLFSKLHQGCVENQEFIGLFTSRMEQEVDYGKRLNAMPLLYEPSKTGFNRDDGASLKNAFRGVALEMGNEGQIHLEIAENIKEMVIVPFSKWSEEHEQRVEYSEKVLRNNLKVYNNKLKVVEKARKRYFNKCRRLESIKSSMTDEELVKEMKALELEQTKSPLSNPKDKLTKLGGVDYTDESLRELFRSMLREIPQKSIKITLLGVYDHVSTGSSIVSWFQKNLEISSVDDCEQLGNELITKGYLKQAGQSVATTLVNNSVFANSSSFLYQWKQPAFEVAQLNLNDGTDERKKYGDLESDNLDNDHDDETKRKVSDYIGDLRNVISYEEQSFSTVMKEVTQTDDKYKKESSKLDKIRCDLEELMVDHLSFMEKCELDRLRALKKVLLDFSLSVSSNISNLKSTIDKIMIYEESISPDGDLLFLLQNYRTGSFIPNVVLYDNYYDNSKDQIFGVDLETRCKNDNKTVPIIISSILSYMDSIYPDLPNDDVRTKIWLIPVRLKATHGLRNDIAKATGSGLTHEFFSNYEPEVIASALKLYLLELPDSIVSNDLYDLIKSIYAQYGLDSENKERIVGIRNILKRNLDRSNISTLNALCTHFKRLISILSENQDSNISSIFQTGISQELSNCILRPKTQSNLSLSDKHSFRFFYDLLTFKDEIFKNLKTTKSKRSSTPSRQNSTLRERLHEAVKNGSGGGGVSSESAESVGKLNPVEQRTATLNDSSVTPNAEIST